ncbi:unnamed protein product [Arctia plantaginis]|uniref:Uncharacterized protein n=1 Tax=Arctia plantaginis TaxID=874455 RepID=A0A8S0ZHK1_ARCPL|nr:unnamed protein product [Arctia plantaginis]
MILYISLCFILVVLADPLPGKHVPLESYESELEREHALPTSVPNADILKTNSNPTYHKPSFQSIPAVFQSIWLGRLIFRLSMFFLLVEVSYQHIHPTARQTISLFAVLVI